MEGVVEQKVQTMDTGKRDLKPEWTVADETDRLDTVLFAPPPHRVTSDPRLQPPTDPRKDPQDW